MKKFFIGPIIASLLALAAVYFWGGIEALVLAAILAVLEITLSFDNAVVNAKVLERMTPKWQQRFLTWGILFAVVGTRLVLPIIIVALAAFMSPWAVTMLAFTSPEQYALLLDSAAPAIESFGGAFLLMVSLKYFFDVAKEVHWISGIERYLSRWGRFEAIEIAIALLVLLIIAYVGHAPHAVVLTAGCIGILLFIFIEGISSSLDIEAGDVVHDVAKGSVVLFMYLNVLDAAFSLDGVVGAFAITTAIPVIVAGLGIGAYFVRTLTLVMVRQKTLSTLRYLENGAHWAILGLGLSMLAGLIVHVPEAVTGLIGLVFVSLSYVSSRREILASKRAAGIS